MLIQSKCHAFVLALRDSCSWVIRSHTVDTQLTTFRILVALIPRYPGIRRLFCHPKDSEQLLSTLKEHWTPEHQDCGDGWTFYRDYALHCLSNTGELTDLVEKIIPSELGCLLKESVARVPTQLESRNCFHCAGQSLILPADALYFLISL